MDDAEQVAVRVREDDQVLPGLRGPMKSRTEAEETLDIGLLVPGIEIQVKPILIQVTFGREIQREVGTSTFGVLEDDPSSVRGILGNVVERLFPESHHSGEVVAIDDDGADSHGTAPVHPPRREFPVPDNPSPLMGEQVLPRSSSCGHPPMSSVKTGVLTRDSAINRPPTTKPSKAVNTTRRPAESRRPSHGSGGPKGDGRRRPGAPYAAMGRPTAVRGKPRRIEGPSGSTARAPRGRRWPRRGAKRGTAPPGMKSRLGRWLPIGREWRQGLRG